MHFLKIVFAECASHLFEIKALVLKEYSRAIIWLLPSFKVCLVTMKLKFLIVFLYCLVNTYNYTVIDIKGDGCFNFLHKVGFYWVNPILQGESNRSPQLIIVHQSLWNALNGLIFHDFVPFNIWKVLGRPFLGFLFEKSEKIYVDHFFHTQSKGGILLYV